MPTDYDVNEDVKSNRTRLKIKIFGGPSAGEVYFFTPTDETILCGRTQECHIRINDKLLSKHQCNIRYDAEQDEWVLTDGLQHKQSTNGTWLYLNANTMLSTGMVFKAN